MRASNRIALTAGAFQEFPIQVGTAYNKIGVLVVDDHPVMRLGILTMIDSQPDMKVVGQSGDAAAVMDLVRRLRPQVIVTDLYLANRTGPQMIRQIRAVAWDARIVAYTACKGDEDIHQALHAGAMGYVIKQMSREVLLRAIRRAADGKLSLPPSVASVLTDRTGATELSLRERQVLALVVGGRSNREIAGQLQIKETTVKSHIRAILTRLNVPDRTRAAVEAIKRGFEHVDP